jgi:tripartite-type tricarboxylate transporter receptor subunit TctC
MVPAATPEPVVQILQRAFTDAFARPDMQARLNTLDLQPDGATGAAAAKRLADVSAHYAQIIRTTGMKVE